MDDAADLKRRLASPAAVAALLGLGADAGEMARRRSRRGGAGARVMVLCPAHGERTASCSLTVGPDGTLRVHCFASDGGCLNGDVFTLIAAVYHCQGDFRAALNHARALLGLDGVPLGQRPPPPVVPLPTLPPRLDDDTFAALAAALLALCPLVEAPDASRYLDGRGILSEALSDGWGALPPRHAQRAILDALRAEHGDDAVGRSGLCPLDPDTDEPILTRFIQPGARILIPWRSPAGAVLTLERRRLDDGAPGRPRYVATRGRSPSSLYGAERVASGRGPLAIVEGAADALARRALLVATGRPPERVVGLPGAGVWHADLLPALPPRSLVYAATDADATGDGVAEAIARDASAAGHIPIRKRPRAPCKDWGAALERLLAGRQQAAAESGERAEP